MNNDEKVLLVRNRPADYYVNYHNGLRQMTYRWNGFVKGRKPHVQAVPREVFDFINTSGGTIQTGELVVAPEEPNRDELLGQILDVEEVLQNVHTRDEIVAILNGGIAKMKSELNKITVASEKKFVMDIAEELEDDLSGAKSKWIEAWFKEELVETK